jgi:hypothetical protein
LISGWLVKKSRTFYLLKIIGLGKATRLKFREENFFYSASIYQNLNSNFETDRKQKRHIFRRFRFHHKFTASGASASMGDIG